MGNIRVIFTADPENIKAILTTQFAEYGKGEQFHKEWEEFLGDGIFTTDGAQWHDSRQLIRPMFVRERVGDLDLFEKHVQKMISLVGPGDGRMVRIDELLFRFSLDAATDYLLGDSVGSLEAQTSDFAAAFNEVQRVQALRSRAGSVVDFTHWRGARQLMERQCCEMANSIQVLQ
jgi:cytochrome P450